MKKPNVALLRIVSVQQQKWARNFSIWKVFQPFEKIAYICMSMDSFDLA
jgi:hypothetical protein